VTHPCPIKRCTAPANDGQLMCWRHWRMVPKILNQAVWGTYRNLRTDPWSYRAARDAAIEAVELKEREYDL
jgi:hypothetical protein